MLNVKGNLTLETTTFNVHFFFIVECKDSAVESGVCGGTAEFDIAGTGVLST